MTSIQVYERSARTSPITRAFTHEFGGDALRRLLLTNKYRLTAFKMVYARTEAYNARGALNTIWIDQFRSMITRVEFIINLTRKNISNFGRDYKYFLRDETNRKLKELLQNEKEYLAKYGKNAYEKLRKDNKL